MVVSVQDGPFSWLLCAASFLNVVMIGGFILTSGMFYLMFKQSLDATDSEVSLITSINIGVMHFICPFVGMLSKRYGERYVSMIGSLLSVLGIACGAFSTQVYHLYIAYGLIAGLGLGMVYNCSVTILNPYFNKHKRTACSLVFTGIGVGSFIFPPILKYLEDLYGWRGAILLLAGINAHMLVSSSLFRPFITTQHQEIFMESNSPNDKKKTSENNIMSCATQVHLNGNAVGNVAKKGGFRHEVLEVFSLFRVIAFSCLLSFRLIYIFALSIVLTHFGSYVLTLGFSRVDVVRLYMTFGISSTIPRPLTGFIAQQTNANIPAVITVTMLVNGAFTLAVPFMDQLWMLYVYAVLFQILLTPYNVLSPVIVMESVPKSQVAVAFGLSNFSCVPGYVLGAPLAVWLHTYTHIYSHSFFLAGGIIIVAGLTMAPASYNYNNSKK